MRDWKTTTQLTDLSEDLIRFEREIGHLAERLCINLDACLIDHIALRCHQESTARRWFDGWRRQGDCFRQSVINGRNIALFSLPVPLVLGRSYINCIELPWPGQRRYPHEGWEHIEIVLPGPAETLAARALSVLSDEALASPDIRIRQSAPRGAGEALPNPTLAVSDGRVTIKFHPHSLREVVDSER